MKVIEIVKEGRAVWIHKSTCKEVGGDRLAKECYQHKLNILFPAVPWLTGSEADEVYWKHIIKPMTIQAHDLGIEVHVWIFFLNATSIDNDESLMQVKENGEIIPLACPANPTSVARNIEKIAPILNEYDIDGLNVEDCFVYHKFPQDPRVCFCKYCIEKAPKDFEERKLWNINQLTNMLREIVRESKKNSPKLKISVAARTPYLSHGLSMSTDWKDWCEKGLLDYITPMIYNTDNIKVSETIQETISLIKNSKVPVYIGLGAYLLDRELKGHEIPDHLASQIILTRKLNSQGQAFYHMGGITVDQWIEIEQNYNEITTPIYFHDL